MFEVSSKIPPLAFRVLKRACLILLAVYLTIGLMAAYRAWFQVKGLELMTIDSVIRPGSVVEATVVSYARTTIDLRLELIQGRHAETVAVKRVPGNEWAFFDPRNRQGSASAVLTADLLSRFDRGTAQLRATAVGREQWTRLPPPEVREVTVRIERN